MRAMRKGQTRKGGKMRWRQWWGAITIRGRPQAAGLERRSRLVQVRQPQWVQLLKHFQDLVEARAAAAVLQVVRAANHQ